MGRLACVYWGGQCQGPSLQTVDHSCTLTLVLDVKSKIKFHHAVVVEVIQANGRGPLEGFKALPAVRGLNSR